MLTNNAHECYLTRRHWPTRDLYPELWSRVDQWRRAQ